MDPNFCNDARRVRARRRFCASHQDYKWSGPTVGSKRVDLERAALQLEISCVPIWSYRGVDGIFRNVALCELAPGSGLSANPDFDRRVTHVCGGALFFRYSFCRDPWNYVCVPGGEMAALGERIRWIELSEPDVS